MTKHRRTRRRSQWGGFSLNPMNWFGSSETVDPNSPSTTEKLKQGLASADSYVGNVAQSSMNAVSSLIPDFSSSNGAVSEAPAVPSTEVNEQNNMSVGGKRRRRSMKGGKGDLGLSYYATPVSGLKVAEPTTWQYYANGTNQYSVKGGSKRRRSRKSRRTRRHRKS